MPIYSIKSSRILLSPLNWGLGHVTRTIPIIRQLLENENEVIICCNEAQEEFYRDFFPELWYVTHEGYPFQFYGEGRWVRDIIKSLPALNRFLKQEKNKVNELVEKFQPDLIISDQRFGFISEKVKSIIISHQLNLPVSNWNFMAKSWNKRLLSQFDEIWVPDTPSQKYSGKLSTGNYKNVFFIGVCSRFELLEIEDKSPPEIKYKYIGLVSGPAPYNYQFLSKLIQEFEKLEEKTLIIVPKSVYKPELESEKITVFPSPKHKKFLELINSSEVVISRSGYSTLMDLVVLNKKAILIPTKGQAEQIYLAELHQAHEKWRFFTEEEFNLGKE